MSTSSSDDSFFDRHTTGLGYVKRVRDVTPKNGDSFLACTIAAFNGPKKRVEYHYYDCNVAGTDAKHLVRRCMNAANDRTRKVLIEYVLGDDWIEPFIYTSGPKTGQAGFWRKARLLFIKWINVDGKRVYTAARNGNSKSTDDARNETAQEPVQEPALEPQDSAERHDDAESLPAAASF